MRWPWPASASPPTTSDLCCSAFRVGFSCYRAAQSNFRSRLVSKSACARQSPKKTSRCEHSTMSALFAQVRGFACVQHTQDDCVFLPSRTLFLRLEPASGHRSHRCDNHMQPRPGPYELAGCRLQYRNCRSMELCACCLLLAGRITTRAAPLTSWSQIHRVRGFTMWQTCGRMPRSR